MIEAGMKLTDQIDIYTYYGQSLLFQTLAYPFLTIQRRLECMVTIYLFISFYRASWVWGF